MNIWILFSQYLLFFTLVQSQTLLYVDPTNTPPGVGSLANPYATFEQAWSAMVAGTAYDIIILKSGLTITASPLAITPTAGNIIRIYPQQPGITLNIGPNGGFTLGGNGCVGTVTIKDFTINMQAGRSTSIPWIFQLPLTTTLQNVFFSRAEGYLMGSAASCSTQTVVMTNVTIDNYYPLFGVFAFQIGQPAVTFTQVTVNNVIPNAYGDTMMVIKNVASNTEVFTITQSNFKNVYFDFTLKENFVITSNTFTACDIVIKSFTTFQFNSNTIVSWGTTGLYFDWTSSASASGTFEFKTNTCSGLNTENTGACIRIASTSAGSPVYTFVIQGNTFANNVAGGGAIAVQDLVNGQINLVSNTFTNNQATGNGGCFSIVRGTTGFKLTMTGNTFTGNKAMYGGVLSVDGGGQFTFSGNTYNGNTAYVSGGVFYFFQTSLGFSQFSDTSSTYSNNVALKLGGSIYADVDKEIKFVTSSFTDETAGYRGGAIYMARGTVNFQTSTFTRCKLTAPTSQGGAIYIGDLVTKISMTTNTFTNCQANYGAAFYTFTPWITGFGLWTISGTTFVYNLASSPIDIESYVFTSGSPRIALATTTINAMTVPFWHVMNGTAAMTSTIINGLSCTSKTNTWCFASFEVPSGESYTSTMSFGGFTLQNVVFGTNVSIFGVYGQGASLTINSKCTFNNIDGMIAIVDGGTFTTTAHSPKTIITQIEQHGFLVKNGGTLNLGHRSVWDNSACFKTTKRMIILLSGATFSSSNFQFTGNVFEGNGGAIYSAGPNSITCSTCTFDYNSASENGGAIYLDDATLSANFVNSNFNENHANLNGGAVFYAQAEGTVPLTPANSRILSINRDYLIFDGCNFDSNYAFISGGAVYSENWPLTLQNGCGFMNNWATNGGALASHSSSATRSWVDSPYFMNNTAFLYGAAMFQMRSPQFDIVSSIELQSNESYPGTFPYNMSMVVSKYDSSVKGYVVVYDDSISNSPPLFSLKSGEIVPYKFEFNITDFLFAQQKDLGQNDGLLTAGIGNVVGGQGSLKGNIFARYNQGTAKFEKNFTLSAKPFSNATIDFIAFISNNRTNQTYVLTNNFTFTFETCVVGEIYDDQTYICNPCAPGKYSFGDPFLTKQCHSCDATKLICEGGAVVYPTPGHWRISAVSDNGVECPNPDACLGGSTTNPLGVCADTYTGNACSNCQEGYAKSGATNVCVNCRTNTMYYVKLGGLFILQVISVILNVYGNYKAGEEDNDTEVKKDLYKATVWKVLADYCQIVGLMSFLTIPKPPTFSGVGTVGKVFPSAYDSFSLDCFFSLMLGNEHLYFKKTLGIIMEPLLFIFFGFLFLAMKDKLCKSKKVAKQSLKKTVILMAVIIITMMQPTLINAAFQMFKCIDIGSSDAPQLFVMNDYDVQCYSSDHLFWLFVVGLPAIFIYFAGPVLVLIYVAKNNVKFSSDETMMKYHFVFKRYAKKAIYWDLIIMLRSGFFIICLTYLDSLYSQIFLAYALFTIMLYVHSRVHPYFDERLNKLEQASLAANCALLFSGIYFMQDTTISIGYILVNIVLVVFNANYWLRQLILLFRMYKDQFEKMKEKFVERRNRRIATLNAKKAKQFALKHGKVAPNPTIPGLNEATDRPVDGPEIPSPLPLELAGSPTPYSPVPEGFETPVITPQNENLLAKLNFGDHDPSDPFFSSKAMRIKSNPSPFRELATPTNDNQNIKLE